MTTEHTPEPVPMPVPVPLDPAARPVSLTQVELDELIRARTDRYRRQLAEARDECDRWRNRAKGNLAVADELRRLYGDLLARLGAPAPASHPAPGTGEQGAA
jgi:hypothetical protein